MCNDFGHRCTSSCLQLNKRSAVLRSEVTFQEQEKSKSKKNTFKKKADITSKVPFFKLSSYQLYQKISSEAPSWVDQWISSGEIDACDDKNDKIKNNGKKMESLKAATSVALGKVKVVAST